MPKQTEICCESSISNESMVKSSDISEDSDDTLEAEISRLEATLHELDENDLSDCCRSAENLGDSGLNDDPNLYEDINENTITNDCDSDSCEDVNEKTILITNFEVPTPIETAESDNNYEKQKWSATDSHKPPENETNDCKEVSSSDQGKATNLKESHAVPSKVSNRVEENEGTENSSGSTDCSENWKTADSNASSDFLQIHPTIDNELEALMNSPISSNVSIINPSLEFSPFRTFQGNWLTSSPKITNPEEYQQSKLTHSVIQNKLVSLVSLLQDKNTEREEQCLKAYHLVISELQSSPQKLAIQQLVKSSTESQSNKESSDSVIILEDFNLKKVSSGSFLDLDISQDCEKEWFTDDEVGECDNIAGFISSTPNRAVFSSSSKSKFLDFHNGESFVVLNETGEVPHADSETKAPEPLSAQKNNTKDLNDSVKDEPKSVEMGDHKELNISVKHAVLEYPLDTITVDNDEVAKPGEVPHANSETKVAELLSAEKNNAKDLNGSEKEIKDEPKSAGDLEELNISVKHVVEHLPETITTENYEVAKSEVPSVDDEEDEDMYVKEIKVIESDYFFTSEDPEENADNFHPGWDVLRNLKTDEERYKAVRDRWRSLVIPNPDVDLTHHSYRTQRNESQEQPEKGSSETQFKMPPAESRHKRTLSDPSSSSQERVAKRSRTKSCTTLFDAKLQQLREQIDDEQHRLLYEESQAVQDLQTVQQIQRIRQQNFYGDYQSRMQTIHQQNYSGYQPVSQLQMLLQNYYSGYQPMSQLQRIYQQNYYGVHRPRSQMQILHERFLQEQRMRQMENEEMIQRRKEEMIRMFYEKARSQTQAEQEKKIRLLEQASTEVQSFCKFYKGLEETEDKDISTYLSETQVEEVWETEDFYEKSEKLYKEIVD